MITCSSCGNKNRDGAKFCKKCGFLLMQPLLVSGPLPPDTVLVNRYKIINLIKTGGMGAVYKAVDFKFNNICAVKELLPPYGTQEEQKRAALWFKREGKLLNRLEHRSLPKVSDYFICNGRYYLIMNFIEGEDLEIKLQKNGKLLEDEVVSLARQILEVLDYLHSQKPPVVYRDVKPGNIMINNEGRAILIDFGIARVVSEASKTKKTAIGTAGYAPPEQCRGKVEPRSDLYALGATMHHLLTGIEPLPFIFEPLKKLIPSVSSELNYTVMKSLELDVENRFPSAKEMLGGLTSRPSISIISCDKKKNVSCKRCGNKNFDMANFCSKCGFLLQENSSSHLFKSEAVSSFPFSDNKSHSGRIGNKRRAAISKPSISVIYKCINCGRENIKKSDLCVYCNYPMDISKSFQSTSLEKSIYCPAGSELLLVPGGIFDMGSNNEEINERPVHKVNINPFYLGKYTVTNREYSAFDPEHNNPGDDLPVVEVSWNNAVAYCCWLSKKEGLDLCYPNMFKSFFSGSNVDITKNGYRLPTEAEWEFACRGGTKNRYYWGDYINKDYLFYIDNSNLELMPSGHCLLPNNFGLYDMSGNVWEWCNDWYGEYLPGYAENPSGPFKGKERILRGGSYRSYGDWCRSSCRNFAHPDLISCDYGFRLAKSLTGY